MAQMPATTQTVPNPVTPDAFVEDRANFWTSFCKFVVFAACVVVLVLLFMLVFLR